MQDLIPPHGGKLINLELSGKEKESVIKKSKHFKKIMIGTQEQSDLLLLGTGVYSPLDRFMTSADYHNVIHHMRLKDGTLWSLPITLSVNEDIAKTLQEDEEIGLIDQQNNLLGILFLKEKYTYDKKKEAKLVYQTTDKNHPGVKRLLNQGEILLGGNICLVQRPVPTFPSFYYDPVHLRNIFKEKGWKTIVAFQTRNPIHRAHEYIQKCALELVDGLLIHPLVGQTKKDDISADIRMESYEVILQRYYPPNRTILAIFPAAMRYAGPREAVFHAICRKNYGCTHLIVGRDHAGVGHYYGTYDAQKLLQSIAKEELGITPLYFDHAFYCMICGNMATNKTCPHSDEERLILSGTKVREMLQLGQELPIEFTRPEVAEVLKQNIIKKTD